MTKPAPNVAAPGGPRGPVFNTFPQPQNVNPQVPQTAQPGVPVQLPAGQQTPAGQPSPTPVAPYGGVAVPGMVAPPPPGQPASPGTVSVADPPARRPIASGSR